MCGRVIQASPPDQLGLKIIDALDPRDSRVSRDRYGNVPPRYNGAPSQQLWVIRRHPETGERSLDLLQWGLIPYWCKEKPKPPPINAKAETVDRLPTFREAYRKRRCIVPIDGFLRVDGDQRREGEAALRHWDAGPVAVRSRWAVGELEEPCHRGVGPNLLRHHNRGKRARRAHSRPHAGDPQAGRLWPVARPRS